MAAWQEDVRRLESAALATARGTATLRIGGEINVDYAAVIRDRGARRPNGSLSSNSQWALHSTNLRFTMDLGQGVEGRIKLDFSEAQSRLPDQVLEEAL